MQNYTLIGAALLTLGLTAPSASADTLSATTDTATIPITKPVFSGEDVFALEWANSVQVSPNGKHIVYVRSRYDIMNDGTRNSLWLIDVESGAHTPLFADQYQYGNPTWSPDGTRLAFTSNRAGKNQIHVYWLALQKLTAVTSVQQSPGNLSWSPNGTHIAFMMNEPAPKTDFAKSVKSASKPKDAKWAPAPIVVERTFYQRDGQGVVPSAYRQVFVVPSDGGSARQLTAGAFDHGGPLTWRDNQHIIFGATRAENWEYQTGEQDLWQVHTQSLELTQLTDQPGGEYSASLSPDGKNLAFLSRSSAPEPYHNAKLQVMNLSSGDIQSLQADFDRSMESPQWLDNKTLAVQYADRGQYNLAQVTLNDRRTDLTDKIGGTSVSRPYLFGMFSAAANSDVIAFTYGSATRPADVAVYDLKQRSEAKRTRVLTALNEDVLGYRELAQLNEFTYESSFDGTEIHGWYLTPPNYDPSKAYPTMVEIHGGPHLAYGPFFSAEHQRYAAEGFVVFYNNYRGSTSYGKDFAMLLDGFYSSDNDLADHLSGLDILIEKGVADPNNLFIAGGSAGGIATAFAVGTTDRFNAAAATNPVINWVSKTLTADSSIGQITNQFPALPWEDPDHYWARSPLSRVGNVKTPVLMFTGEKDRRTPIAETEQFYQALKIRQVPTVMVRIPDAYHGVTARPSRINAKVDYTVAWFKRYLKSADGD
ncbi:peptidase S9 family protein [Pseudidiomarina aestuarii]|uniref:Peptidase S9 family protein n=1 Tax=Pseudidiomarina aestuarii TaxID=624146 RepID=A0A2T4D597_9GAMM|nr:peptidase S9 family protein [Pseudidiomarina aestuarii]